MHALDPHERPPEHIRTAYKKYQKMKSEHLEKDPDILDPEHHLPAHLHGRLRVVEEWDLWRLTATFRRFSGDHGVEPIQSAKLPVYEHEDMPGRS